ncbi:hypothetical protein MMC07_001371 [Pseudocyphellaria aurata]|nr:hypothetical protein [Pseudocyphellaria aurata]
MFRNESGKVSWSWSRLVLNAVPNNANDCKNEADLTPKQQDDLFRFQLTQLDPRILSEQSFYIAGIVDHPSLSPRILAALHKASILTSSPPFVHTSLITRKFPHQVAIISVHRQRKLVSLLFFWEEELMRWRLLEEEENEVRRFLDEENNAGEGGEREEELRVALGRVRARRCMPPSLRVLANDAKVQPVLPSYGDAKMTVPVELVAKAN